MRKYIYSVLAFAAVLTVSCSKEQNVEPPFQEEVPTHAVTIKGTYAQTKTAYANDKIFSWLAGDEIAVQEDLEGTAKFDVFTAASEGATTDFNGEISDGATLGPWAVYPTTLNPAVDTDGFLTVTLPRSYALDYPESDYPQISSDNPLSQLPLVGQKADDEDTYTFVTATGVARFSLYNVPEGTTFLAISSASEPLYGDFLVDFDGIVYLENYNGNGGTFAYSVVTPTEENTLDVYFPLPVGTYGAGLTISLLAEDGATTLFSRTTTKDIEIGANHVTEIAALNATPAWKEIGTGQFNDAWLFGNGFYVDVTIEQNTENPVEYRISNPYAPAYEAFEYTVQSGVSGPEDYLVIQVLDKDTEVGGLTLPAGTVTFNNYYTGFVSTGYSATTRYYELALLPVTAFDTSLQTLNRFTHSRVLKYQADGSLPANIQLAPVYYLDTGYLSDLTTNGNIQIVFPGNEPLDLTEEITIDGLAATSTTAAPVLSASVTLGDALTAKIAAGETEDEALAAIAAGTATDVTSGTVEVALPANALSGTYVVVMQTYLGSEEWDTFPLNYDYVNPDQKPLTIEDVIGEYTVTTTSNYYGDEETSFTIEASDDADKGNVMFTGSFLGFPVNASIYATLEESGKLTIENGQVFYSSGSTSIKIYTLVLDGGSLYFGSDPTVLQFSAPGQVKSSFGSNNLGFLNSSNQIYDMITALSGTRIEEDPVIDDGTVVPAGAPAKAPALVKAARGPVVMKDPKGLSVTKR